MARPVRFRLSPLSATLLLALGSVLPAAIKAQTSPQILIGDGGAGGGNAGGGGIGGGGGAGAADGGGGAGGQFGQVGTSGSVFVGGVDYASNSFDYLAGAGGGGIGPNGNGGSISSAGSGRGGGSGASGSGGSYGYAYAEGGGGGGAGATPGAGGGASGAAGGGGGAQDGADLIYTTTSSGTPVHSTPPASGSGLGANGGGSNNTGATLTDASVTTFLGTHTSIGDLGVGGGGGGGGTSSAGGAGGSGILTVESVSSLSVTGSTSVGGAGGGGGAGNAGGTGGTGTIYFNSSQLSSGILGIGGTGGGGGAGGSGAVGGNGGNGTVVFGTSSGGGASGLNVGEVIVGGSGGGGGVAAGGSGGNGVLDMSGGTLAVNYLLVGGTGGNDNFGAAGPGNGGSGTVMGGNSLRSSQLVVGGEGGSVSLDNRTGGAGGMGSLTAMGASSTGLALIGGNGGLGLGGANGKGGDGGSGTLTVGGGTLTIDSALAPNNYTGLGRSLLLVGGSGGGSYDASTGGAGGQGTVNVDGGNVSILNGDVVIGGSGGAGNGTNGNGGKGVVNVAAGRTLDVDGTLTVGGYGGDGGFSGTGGAGGSGELNVHGTVLLDNSLVVGGTAGAGTDAGAGGTGTLNLYDGGQISFNGGPGLTIRSTGFINLYRSCDGTGGASDCFVGLTALQNDSTLNFTQSGASTISQAVSGTGQIAQTGTGTTTLTGTNTYTGATLVFAGTLIVTGDNSGASGPIRTYAGGTLQVGNGGAGATLGQGNVQNDGTLAFNHSDNLVVGNAISGTGALTLAGTGTTILTGNNSYTGTTTIGSGTLQVGNGGLTGSLGTGAVRNDGTLVFNRNAAGVVALPNTLTGGGNLEQMGVATLSLTGDGSGYTGTYTVGAGSTLDISQGGKFGTGAIVNSGLLSLDPANDLTVGNAISGGGNVSLNNTVTVTLTGDNTYTGRTTVNFGTLQIGNGGTSGSLGTGAVTNNGTLAFNRSDDITVANAISGTGALNQNGAGKLVLDGNVSAGGGVNVNAGSLVVGGESGSTASLTTPGVNVSSGATLGGHGTVNGTVAVASGATLSPGNSIGTLAVNGNVNFAGGSIYRVETDAAGNADKLVVTGAANIRGGTVDVQAQDGNYAASTSYSILSATQGVNGTFSNVTSNLAFLTPSLAYTSNDITLTLARNGTTYASVACTPNQRAVSGYLDANGGAGLANIINSLTAAQACKAYEGISGSTHTVASRIAYLNNAPIDIVMEHIAGSAGGLSTMWGQAFYGHGSTGSDGNGPSASYNTDGMVFGYDLPVGENWQVGLAFSYQGMDWGANSLGNGDVQTPTAIAYGRYGGFGPLQLRFAADVGIPNFGSTRNADMVNAFQSLTSSHGANKQNVVAEAEYSLPQLGGWSISPIFGIQHIRLNEDGFTEKGGSAALDVYGRSTIGTVLTVGSRVKRTFFNDILKFESLLKVSHLTGDNDSPVTANIVGQPGRFTVNGVPIQRNDVNMLIKLDAKLTTFLIGYARISADVRGAGQNEFSATAGVRMAW